MLPAFGVSPCFTRNDFKGEYEERGWFFHLKHNHLTYFTRGQINGSGQISRMMVEAVNAAMANGITK
jgi:hypothetical protein